MPRRKPTTSPAIPTLPKRSSSRQTTLDDSSVDEDTPLSQLPHKRTTHPGQPTTSQSRPPSQTSSSRIQTPLVPPIQTNQASSASSAPSHKRVNAKSTNRRQCKRASDDLSSSTPDHNNLSQRKHEFSTRLTLKINCGASEDPEELLLNIFDEFVQELVRADSTAAVLPWKSIHRSKGNLTKSSDIPKTTRLLRTYLNRFYISRTPNTPFITYPGIHVGHDKPLSELRDDMSLWLQDGDHGLYYKMLQVEESSEIGWFLYSTREMDAGALVDEIEDLVGLKVGLRWKIIDVGAKGKLPESQRVQALNVEVSSRNRWEAQRKLIKYFGKDLKHLKDYPNGIRLRFVKNKKDGVSPVEKSKIERLRARQKVFLSTIVTISTWDVIQLDYSSDPNTPTLRQMIMELKTEKDDIPLFHCVDLDWRGEGYTFQFAPGVKVEAECTINSLLPILNYKYPNKDLEKYFSHEAVDRCEGYAYDPTKGVVVDSLINDHLTFIDEENLLGFAFDKTVVEETENETGTERPQPPQTLYPDNDSVSTLAKPRVAYMTPVVHQNISTARTEARSSDNTSVTSATSTVTMETVNSIIETKLTAITAHIRNNDRKFDELMSILKTNNARGQASSTNSQTCTAAVGLSEAGEDSESVSSGVQ